MEDSHIANLAFGPNKDLKLFGVFDGHGGKHISF
jgi:serine/threonine protein phosphatase PrpC